MRKAFTMIEIIFVIVIIGILASVGIPKLIANRDDAKSSVCAHEVGQLIHEIGNSYMKHGYTEFRNLTISTITNIPTNVGLSRNGIFEAATTTVDSVGVTYYCNGEALIQLIGNIASNDYNLTIQDQSPTTPTGLKAALKLRSIHGMNAGQIRLYKL